MKSYKLINIIAAAAGSLLQQKLRSFLSVLGVVCGVMAVIAMLSIGEGGKRETLRQIEQLGTRNIYIKPISQTREQEISARAHLSQGLTLTDLERIRNSPAELTAVAALREIKVAVLEAGDAWMPQVAACSDNYAEILNATLSAGRFIASQDRRYKQLVCVLGHDAARRLGDAGKIGAWLRMDAHLVKVVGILDRVALADDRQAAISARNLNEMIFVPLESARTLDRPEIGTSATEGGAMQARTDALQLSEIVVQAARTEAVARAAALINRTLQVTHNNARDYQIVVPLELLHQSQRTQRTLNLVLGSIAAIALIVGGIGIMNIMLATVSERTHEIGIRRAVGATRGDIMAQFLAEAILLTGAGGIIGLLGGLATVTIFSAISGWQTALSFWGVGLPLQLSLMVGIFFGLYPAKKAAAVDPITALRHQ